MSDLSEVTIEVCHRCGLRKLPDGTIDFQGRWLMRFLEWFDPCQHEWVREGDVLDEFLGL